MFQNNKYTKTYYKLIEKRKRNPPTDEYSENHHIMPRSLGGTDTIDNMVRLTAREHFIAHLLLTKMVNEATQIRSMHWALHRMCYSGIDYFNGRQYEWYRKQHVNFLKKFHPMKRPEIAAKISNAVSENWKNNEERRQKVSDTFKQYWKDNYDACSERNRQYAKKGAEAARLINSKKIEYKGETYLGWNDLFISTGISKFLYKKFYLNGFDPSDRIGRNGPLPKNYIFKPLDKKENQ